MAKYKLLIALQITGNLQDVTLSKEGKPNPDHAQFPLPTRRCAPALASLATIGVQEVDVSGVMDNDFIVAAKPVIEALPGWKVTSTAVIPRSQWDGTKWVKPTVTVKGFMLEYSGDVIFGLGQTGAYADVNNNYKEARLSAFVQLQKA